MRMEESIFKTFIKGIQEWLPCYYSNIMDTLIVDIAGYNMGFDKEPMYIFDLNISNDEISKLTILSSNLKNKATKNGMFDEELFEQYDNLTGFITILSFYLKN